MIENDHSHKARKFSNFNCGLFLLPLHVLLE